MSSEKYRAKKVKDAIGTNPNLYGVSEIHQKLFNDDINKSPFLFNKLKVNVYGFYSKYAIQPSDAYNVRLINCRVREQNSGMQAVFCQILIVDRPDVSKPRSRYYSFEPSLGSQDGEFRGRTITHDLMLSMMELEDFNKMRKFASDYLREHLLKLTMDYFGPQHQREETLNVALLTDFFAIALIIATHKRLTGSAENHLFAPYIDLLARDEKFYRKFIKTPENAKFLRTYFNPGKYVLGRKIISVTTLETVHPEDIKYSAWREFYISRKCNDLGLNEISYNFPYCMDWVIIHNASADMYDNKAMHKRYEHSRVAGEIIESLIKSNQRNYVSENDSTAGGKVPLSMKFLRLSRKIENAMNYAESYLFLSDIALCLHFEAQGRTFRDIPALITAREKTNPEYVADTYAEYRPEIFANPDIFASILFDYIYGLNALHEKLGILHGDPHLNNITLLVGGGYGRLLEKNSDKKFATASFCNNGAYMFPATEYVGIVIDFSRAVIANAEMIEFDHGKVFREKFFAEQEGWILVLLKTHIEKFTNANFDSLRARIIDSLDKMFPILTALDYYIMARAMRHFLSGISNIKIAPECLHLVSALESHMFHHLSTELSKLVSNSSASPEFPVYAFLDKHYSKYFVPDNSAKLPFKYDRICAVRNMHRGIEYTTTPPNLPPEIDEDVQKYIEEEADKKSLAEFDILGDKNERRMHEFSLSQSWKFI